MGKEFDALWIKGQSVSMWDNGIAAAPRKKVIESESKVEGEKERLRKDWERTFEKWVWGGDDRDIAGVWVRGRRVV